jgi:hypothetical protein
LLGGIWAPDRREILHQLLQSEEKHPKVMIHPTSVADHDKALRKTLELAGNVGDSVGHGGAVLVGLADGCELCYLRN